MGGPLRDPQLKPEARADHDVRNVVMLRQGRSAGLRLCSWYSIAPFELPYEAGCLTMTFLYRSESSRVGPWDRF